jgi:hypothetical protein
MNAQLLGRELLQTIGILRLGWPGVFLLQTPSLDLGLELLSLGIDARRGGVEQALDFGDSAGLHHVEGNHRVIVHDDGVVALDKSHSTHIGGQVENVITPLDDLGAVLEQSQVNEHKLVTKNILLHTMWVIYASRSVVEPAIWLVGEAGAPLGGIPSLKVSSPQAPTAGNAQACVHCVSNRKQRCNGPRSSASWPNDCKGRREW